MRCWLASEPRFDAHGRFLRTTFAEVEVSGVICSNSGMALVVASPRPFSIGCRAAVRWNGATRRGTIEDCFPHRGRFLLWLDVEPRAVAAGQPERIH